LAGTDCGVGAAITTEATLARTRNMAWNFNMVKSDNEVGLLNKIVAE
jgi:hypothetical protein